MTTPEFKEGDKVYALDSNQVGKILEYTPYSTLIISMNHKTMVHATRENYEMLCKLFPSIEWEKPKKVLRGDELCRHLLKTQKLVLSVITDYSTTYKDVLMGDEYSHDSIRIVASELGSIFRMTDGSAFMHAIPIDPVTGKVLEMEVEE